MRRRLTVSQCSAGKASEKGNSDVDQSSKIINNGLTEVFELAKKNSTKVALIASVTDGDLTRRRSFAEKDTDCLSTFPSPADAMRWVSSHYVGWSCRKGMKPESPNQDSFSVLLVEDEFSLYCVFDGHGPHGHDVSHFVRQTIAKLFLRNMNRATNPSLAFHEAFIGTQLLVEEEAGLDASMSGTTCTMAYHDLKRDLLTVAHVGDSRAVLGMMKPDVMVEDLTVDHKPNLEKERQRIESADPPGRVVFDGYYNHRVFVQNGMYPGLNMSRAIGDVLGHKGAGLTAEPDVKVVDLSAERFKKDGALSLLLCTDGVWEFIKSEEAVELAFKFPADRAEEAMGNLVKLGYDRWMEDSDNEISDDITGILVDLSRPKVSST